MLGISTQVTAVWSYISDGPYKTYEWNSTKLEFKHRTNKEITGLSYMTSLVIQALKTLGKSNVTTDIIQTLSEKLSDQEAVPGTLKLVPPEYRFVALAADYEAMKDMLYGDIPTFETVINAVRQLEREINAL